MKVKDLIELLEKENPENDIAIARDPEGNGIHTIDEVAYYGKGMVVIWPTDHEIWSEEEE